MERLRVAAMEGRIDADELEERLTAAYSARWCSELAPLTVDVTPPPPAPRRARPMVVPTGRRTNGLAVASMIAALCVWTGPWAAVAAIVFGHIALSRISRSGGVQKGRGFAYTGLMLGYLEILAIALFMVVGLVAWH